MAGPVPLLQNPVSPPVDAGRHLHADELHALDMLHNYHKCLHRILVLDLDEGITAAVRSYLKSRYPAQRESAPSSDGLPGIGIEGSTVVDTPEARVVPPHPSVPNSNVAEEDIHESLYDSSAAVPLIGGQLEEPTTRDAHRVVRIVPHRPPRNDLRDLSHGKELRRSRKEHRLEKVFSHKADKTDLKRKYPSSASQHASPTTPPAELAANASQTLAAAEQLDHLTEVKTTNGQTNQDPVIPDLVCLCGADARQLHAIHPPVDGATPSVPSEWHGHLEKAIEEARDVLAEHRVDVAAYIGSGTFGSIYRATRDGVLVALKVISKPHAYHYEDGRDMILRELHVLRTAAQKRIPYVLPLYESFSDSNCVYIVTVAALAALHSQGILHCDIKLNNIMLDVSGDACLIDFGLSKVTGLPKELGFDGGGYELYNDFADGYQPPEFKVPGYAGSHDTRSDIWCLGLVFLQLMLWRANPSSWNPASGREEDWQDHYQIKGVPDKMARDLLAQMMHPEPEQRATMKQIMEHQFFTSAGFELMGQHRELPLPRPGDPCKVRDIFRPRFFANASRLSPLALQRQMDEEAANPDAYNFPPVKDFFYPY
ncbi:hypothetical protein EIP91_008597 [Steccherinum ochraceum]|uniref:Protein kinase domain-containing protein n=1 Tax=Steccherinum ochraceum TaxID=92696 RepID=A0A4R0RKT7_9APHY|nr:hypothetical protein EIP91_008597 [Steccherinum ochraceum]